MLQTLSQLQLAIMNLIFAASGGGGLSDIYKKFVEDWAGPAFLIIIVVVAIPMIKERQFRNLLIFLVFAAVIGVIVFYGEDIFGKDKGITNATKGLVDSINTITFVGKNYFKIICHSLM